MKTNNNLEKSDKLIVCLAAICALLLFSWLVYDVAFLNPLLEGQVEIGKIYQTKNKVKRKFNKSLIWYAASSNEIVFENDWIFTGSDSIAKIKLNSGGEIIVEPDSLIVLSRKNGVLQLDLQHGRLMAKVKKKDININIVRDGAIESVDTSEGIVSVAQEELSEKVEIDLIDDGGFSENEELSLDEIADRKYYKPEKGFSGLEENGLSYKIFNYKSVKLFPDQSTTIPVTWTDPLNHWSSYEFEVATDKDFTNLIKQEKTETTTHQIPTKKAGIYHWRVRGLNKEGKESKWSNNLISEVDINWLKIGPAVQISRKNLKYQLDNKDLEALLPDKSHDLTDRKPLSIEWAPDKNASKYRVQTSDKADFSNILEEKIQETTTLDFKNLKLGNTYYRIIPENDKGEAVAMEAKGKVRTLLPSPDDSSLKTIDKDEFQVMKWEPVPYAEKYEITYTHDKNSDEKIVEHVTGNKLSVENKTGFLQWKVRVIDPKTNERLSRFSKTVDWYDAAKRLASLHGTGQAGTLYPIITKPEPRKTFISINNSSLFIVMTWKYEKEAIGYDVEISKTSNMEQLVYKKKIKGKKRAVINQKFKPGIYYMRVRANHKQVTDESWSEPEIFRVIHR